MNISPALSSELLSQSRLIAQLRGVFETFVDARTGKNCQYTVADAALSAFSVFFMQCPSFLDYQRSLQATGGDNNVRSLFGAHKVPSDNQIRSLLDQTPPDTVAPMFDYVVDALQAQGILEQFRDLNGTLLLALDGTCYFSSATLHCDHCSTAQHANGQTTYSHTVVTPVLVKPGQNKVIALAPEFVTRQDGSVKQDCELAAAKRWLQTGRERFSPFGVTLLGDDLYCHAPFCRQAREAGFHFVFVCKHDSHVTVYEDLADLERNHLVQTLTQRRWNGKTHIIDSYRWAGALPLRAGKDALLINWCELTSVNDAGRMLYHNTFATSHPVNASNVAAVVAAGRARWKIENENNNILKTKGYHFEHNFGHGKKHLASLLATLIILAYLMHTVLDWVDQRYRQLRQKRPSRQHFFNDLRTIACYLLFDSWDAMLDFMLKALEHPYRPVDIGAQSP